MNKLAIAVFLVLLVLLGVYLVFSIFSSEPIKLDAVEVREYQGEKLSSVNDFRENSIKGPQNVDINSYKLEVTGLVNEPKNYTYQEILDEFQDYEKVVQLNCVEGWEVNILWRGILVKDIINQSKPSNNATVVIFYAVDGYSTSLPLDYIEKNNIMLAYKMNNATLAPERGFPFQLVAESKWGYKWIKWVQKIELSNDTNYRGYWESRGYSNSANIDEEFI
ncbi:MAG: molybdopterin-dependent oxidoreductase [Methanobacteriaceae archaeon]|nr:molybdopterin-dependent oxidoreductase [Methanobacteriaceae archaeon]